jgi:hypothetical protein
VIVKYWRPPTILLYSIASAEDRSSPSTTVILSVVDIGVVVVAHLNIPARCNKSKEYFFCVITSPLAREATSTPRK